MSSSWRDQLEVISESIQIDANDLAEDDLWQPCSCRARAGSRDDGDICIDTSCANYATQVECKRGKCGPTCRNNRFQSLRSIDLDVVEFPMKGFGLVARTDIKAHSFLGEYVGELVSEKELTRRTKDALAEKHLYD